MSQNTVLWHVFSLQLHAQHVSVLRRRHAVFLSECAIKMLLRVKSRFFRYAFNGFVGQDHFAAKAVEFDIVKIFFICHAGVFADDAADVRRGIMKFFT